MYFRDSLCVTSVNKKAIQSTFSPLISAAKEQLAEEVEQHRALISERYGEDSSHAFYDTTDIDAPIVLESLYAQKADALAQKVDQERKLREEAQARAIFTDRDRQELARLKVNEMRRSNQARRNKRKAAAKKKKR